ncbi:Sugar phosphate isomerase/epimerase [Asanoa hainanensis]|uniref:Sugar phosphate isomerase/epimerase n=1 Tax=Asanoa hainanensis TaxID=560556 RepID=A0A239MDZ1_9ACTN|nr:Sugar phosphate isomerase/epimerase [Asanoa hainanensis]
MWSQGFFLNVVDDDPAPIAELLARSADLDQIGHVEIWLERVPETPAQSSRLAKLLSGRRVVVHAPFVGISLVGPAKELRLASEMRLARAHSVACDLGAELITMHSGPAFFRTERSEAHDRLAESLTRLGAANSDGPAITIENMAVRRGVTYEPVVEPADFAELLSRVPNLRITLDVGHAIQSGINPRAFFREHGPLIGNIHLHDGVAGGRAHLALGDGQLDLPSLAPDLDRYSGFVGIEVFAWEGVVTSWPAARMLRSVERRR